MTRRLLSPRPRRALQSRAIRKPSRLQLAVNIVVLAAIYALIACGYVLIYRVSRVLNLAHGELMMLGAYLLLATASLFAGHPVIALGAAVLLSLMVGVLVYVFLMRKMTGEMVLAAVLTTVALGILLRGLIVLIWSAQQQYPAQALGFTNPAMALPGGGRISTFAALLVLTNIAVYGALFVFLRFGRWGVRMRAAGQNPLLAAQRGINLHAVYALAWGLSTLTGSIAGMLIALDSGLTSTMAVIGLKAFPAALVGGLDSLLGALVGALIVAGAEVLLDPLRRSAAVRRGAVPGADRDAGRAALGPVRHARGARPCLGRAARQRLFPHRLRAGSWRCCRRAAERVSLVVLLVGAVLAFRSSPRRSSSISPARCFWPRSARCR